MKKKYSLIQKIKTKLYIIIFVLFIIYLFLSKKIEEFNKSNSGGMCENDLITFECENYSESDVLQSLPLLSLNIMISGGDDGPGADSFKLPKGKMYYKYNTESEIWEYIGGQSTMQQILTTDAVKEEMTKVELNNLAQILSTERLLDPDFDCPCDHPEDGSCSVMFEGGMWRGVEGVQESCSSTCERTGLTCDSNPWNINTEVDMITAILAAGKDPGVVCSGGFIGTELQSVGTPMQQYSNSKYICYYQLESSDSDETPCNQSPGQGASRLCKCI